MAEFQNDGLTNIVAMLSGETDISKINYLVDSVKSKVINYCNITTLPLELEDVVVGIVVTRLDKENNLSSLGSLKFEPKKFTIDELEPHKPLLNKFRKVK